MQSSFFTQETTERERERGRRASAPRHHQLLPLEETRRNLPLSSTCFGKLDNNSCRSNLAPYSYSAVWTIASTIVYFLRLFRCCSLHLRTAPSSPFFSSPEIKKKNLQVRSTSIYSVRSLHKVIYWRLLGEQGKNLCIFFLLRLFPLPAVVMHWKHFVALVKTH